MDTTAKRKLPWWGNLLVIPVVFSVMIGLMVGFIIGPVFHAIRIGMKSSYDFWDMKDLEK